MSFPSMRPKVILVSAWMHNMSAVSPARSGFCLMRSAQGPRQVGEFLRDVVAEHEEGVNATISMTKYIECAITRSPDDLVGGGPAEVVVNRPRSAASSGPLAAVRTRSEHRG